MIKMQPVPELKRLILTRIAATPAALDAATWPKEAIVLRTAPDELLIYPVQTEIVLVDPYAIVIEDGGNSGIWLHTSTALNFLERSCEWELPRERPAFAQGAVAGIPTKLWFEDEKVLFIVSAPFATELADRMHINASKGYT